MGFWKDLRAILSGPDILEEVKTLRESLRETEQELENCVSQAETNDLLWERSVERARDEAASYRAALLAVCPRPSSAEEMKQLYDSIAPYLDKGGFALYRAAERLTGIDVYSEFPYEDNRGMFEEADGHKLLRYLTAAYFRAVKWDIVPGTTYESATLLAVDTSTPEYRRFERQLYERALEKLGFQVVLAPAARENAKGRQPEAADRDALQSKKAKGGDSR